MQLEDSNGKMFAPQTVTEVTETIDCLGSGLEHRNGRNSKRL